MWSPRHLPDTVAATTHLCRLCGSDGLHRHLNVVPLHGLMPQEQGGDAGHEAAQEAAQDAGLVEVLTVPVDQTRLAECSTET